MARKKKKDEETPEQAGVVAQPPAGVEGRSLDGENEGDAAQDEAEDLPNAEQSDEGTFTKDYVILGTEFDEETELPKYERNVRQQAQQVGLRTTGDVKLKGTEKQSDGESLRVTFEVPVVRAAATGAEGEATVSAVAANDEVGDDLDDPEVKTRKEPRDESQDGLES